MDKLFLLDAYALIYRAYYAFIKNPRINSKGMNTSAVMGFVNTLNEILTKEQPLLTARIMQELDRGAGAQFDPELVPIFIDLVKRGEISPVYGKLPAE